MKLDSKSMALVFIVVALIGGVGCAGDAGGAVDSDQQGLRGAAQRGDADRDKDADEVADEAARGDAGRIRHRDRDADVDEAADEAADDADAGSDECRGGWRGFDGHRGFGDSSGVGDRGGWDGRR